MNRAVIRTRELGYLEVYRSNEPRAGRSLGSRQAGAGRGRSRGNCEGPESKSQGNSSHRTGELCSRQGGEHGTGSAGKPRAGVRRFRPNQADRSPPKAGENRSDELFVDVRIRESDNFHGLSTQRNRIQHFGGVDWCPATLRSAGGIQANDHGPGKFWNQEVRIPSANVALLSNGKRNHGNPSHGNDSKHNRGNQSKQSTSSKGPKCRKCHNYWHIAKDCRSTKKGDAFCSVLSTFECLLVL